MRRPRRRQSEIATGSVERPGDVSPSSSSESPAARAGAEGESRQRGSARPRQAGYLFRPKYPPPGMTYPEAAKQGLLRESSVWWFRARHRGRVYKWNTHQTSQTDAERFAKKKLGELGLGRPVGPDVERTTFADLERMIRDDYAANTRRSSDRLATSLAHLRAWFGADLAIDITADRITAYTAARLKEDKAASGTVNRELSCLKRMLRLGERAGKVTVRPYIAMLAENNALFVYDE